MQSMIPLSSLKSGEQAVIRKLESGKMLAARLTSLGFTNGVAIEMKQNYGHGPLVVSVRDTRIALGRGEAAAILVERGEA